LWGVTPYVRDYMIRGLDDAAQVKA